MRMTRLDFDEPPSMAPSVNVACRITPDSPLSGQTYWDLESEGAAICVSVSATDNQHFQEVFARKIYLVQVRNQHVPFHGLHSMWYSYDGIFS